MSKFSHDADNAADDNTSMFSSKTAELKTKNFRSSFQIFNMKSQKSDNFICYRGLQSFLS